MNVDDLPDTVWVGEAYERVPDGTDQRIERVVHLTEDDAHEDIRTLADSADADYITVERERLYTGVAGSD